jgi:hypothetical protein
MNNEQKDLLLKDLCSRLPYGVKVQIDLQSDIYPPMICKVCNIEFAEMGGSFIGVEVLPDSYSEYREFLCKPCLFPLSSMTDEQKEEYSNLLDDILDDFGHSAHFDTIESIDWLYEHHFDIHSLIPLGLAIDCTNLNIY